MTSRVLTRAGGVVLAMLLLVPVTVVQAQVQADIPANQFDQLRTRSFTYQANGALASETIEPGKAQSCVSTAYAYDASGNVNSQTSSNCAGAAGHALFTSRTNSASYAGVASQAILVGGVATNVAVQAGLVRTSTMNALNQSDSAQFDPRFGSVIRSTGLNGLSTSVALDDFGRPVRTSSPDGTSVVTLYCLLSAPGGELSSNSAGCPTPTASEAPTDATYLVHSEPRNTADVKMGAFSRQYYDKAGHLLRMVTQGFDGTNQPAAVNGALVVQDLVYNAYGARYLESRPYFLPTKASTTLASNVVGATQTTFDVLGRPLTVASSNAASAVNVTFGATGSVGYGVYGAQPAATTTYQYDAVTVSVLNAKSQARTEERNADGALARVTDAAGAQVAYQYDGFGNLIKTVDALHNAITMLYDQRGRQVQLSDPDKGLWKYDHDALGQTVWQENPTERALAQSTSFIYDVLGRTTQRNEPEYTSNWYYDRYRDASACNMGLGKLCEATTGNTVDVDRKMAYDNLGRPASQRTDINTANQHFASSVSYEASTGRLSGRVYPSGLQLSQAYTANGYLAGLYLQTPLTVNPLPNAQGVTAAPGSLAVNAALWRVDAMGAAGAIEQNLLSSGVVDKRVFEAASGRLTDVSSGAGGATTVLNEHYSWDTLNNLTGRIDNNGSGAGDPVSETFAYGDNSDNTRNLNRLTQYTVAGPSVPGLARSVVLQYNALGMLLYKSDVGVYAYGASGAGSLRPHAVQTVAGALSAAYFADANGNVTSATGAKYATLAYTSFDRIASAAGPGSGGAAVQYAWNYDESHMRIKQTRTIAGAGTYAGTRTTWYMHPDAAGGLDFESENNQPTTPSSANPALISNRHYLSIGGQAIGVLVTTGALPALTAGQMAPAALTINTVSVKLEYWHKDHLGSLIATSDHTGALTARYSYDPFGKRRAPTGAYDAAGVVTADWSPALNAGTDRGFTGHEALDDIGLVNTNGRLYDATLGRFTQADALITNPDDTQGYDRYAYVRNNPLNASDPSGFEDQRYEIPGHKQDPDEQPLGGGNQFHSGADTPTSPPRVNKQANVNTNKSISASPRVTSPALKDGIAGVGSERYSGYAGVDWMIGNFFGQLTGVALEAAGLLSDIAGGLFSQASGGYFGPGVPRSSLVQAVDQGAMTSNEAAMALVTAPVVAVQQIVINGWKVVRNEQGADLKETVATAATLFLPIKFGAAKGAGIVAKDGTAITGLTKHGVDRVIGDGAKRAGTKPDAILDAVKNPTKIKEGVDNLGRPFKVYTGENARVVMNPETGKIISTNPLSREGAHLP